MNQDKKEREREELPSPLQGAALEAGEPSEAGEFHERGVN